MKRNAAITAWSARTGCDAAGQPTFTAQSGGPWRVLFELKSKRLRVGGRDLVSSARVHIQGDAPAINQGDRVTVAAIVYEVLAADVVPAGTLRHRTLYLA